MTFGSSGSSVLCDGSNVPCDDAIAFRSAVDGAGVISFLGVIGSHDSGVDSDRAVGFRCGVDLMLWCYY